MVGARFAYNQCCSYRITLVMTKRLSVIFLLFFYFSGSAQQQWSWIAGDKSPNAAGIYGDKGVASSQNFPGSRMGSSTWIDKNGQMWMFGGIGKDADGRTGYLNDLWKYNAADKQWIWVGGSSKVDAAGSYGKKEVAAPDNQPGARQNAASWTDSEGNFWLFGGMGIGGRQKEKEEEEKEEDKEKEKEDKEKKDREEKDKKDKEKKDREKKDREKKEKEKKEREEKEKNEKDKNDKEKNDKKDKDKKGNDSILESEAKSEEGLLNDLWMYSPSTGQWTWISGSASPNKKSKNNSPGSRYMSSSWIDNANTLWLFGGSGYSSKNGVSDLNDTWKFSIASKKWTLINDDSKETNVPPGRKGTTTWVDKNEDFWLFGGANASNYFSDLWKYNSNSNTWVFIGAANNNSNSAHPGSRTLGSGWTDSENNLWLFGGKGFESSNANPLNSLWKYNIATNSWSLVKGDASNNPVTSYGTRGTASDTNTPGGTANAAAWKMRDGTAWIFGGESSNGYTNLVWKLAAAGCAEKITGSIEPSSASICQGGTQTLRATGGSSYKWMRDGQPLNAQTSPSIIINLPGTYSAIISDGGCNTPVTVTSTITFNDTASGIRYPDINAVADASIQLSARKPGVSYVWAPATGLDRPNSDAPTARASSNQEYLVYVTGEQGCIITDTQFIKIENKEVKKVAVPTAFTPNGNGTNDVLRPLGELSSLDYFRVYNRWGKMLYQTTTVGDGWNGKLSGVVQPSETYTWILSGKTTDGQPVKLSGKTVLVR